MFNHSIKIVHIHTKKQNKKQMYKIKLAQEFKTTTLNTIKFIFDQITKHTSITLLLRLMNEVRPSTSIILFFQDPKIQCTIKIIRFNEPSIFKQFYFVTYADEMCIIWSIFVHRELTHPYISIYIHIYIYTLVNAHTHMYKYTYIDIFIFIHIHIHTYTHIYTHTCIFIYTKKK